MELYRKQLNSVAELRREKKRLKVDRKIAAENAEAVEQARDEGDPLASILGVAGDLFASKGVGSALIGLAMPVFRTALRKTEGGLLKKAAKEVLGGYVKWKAIDFGVTLAMRFIRRQKYKAEREASS